MQALGTIGECWGLCWHVAARRGQRGQTAGDAWCTRGRQVLKPVEHCSFISVKPIEPDSMTWRASNSKTVAS